MHTNMTEEPPHEHFSASAQVAEAKSCTELNHYFNYMGLLKKTDEPMPEYWAERGSSQCQNADANLILAFNFCNGMFYTRCSPSYFTRILTLTRTKIQALFVTGE